LVWKIFDGCIRSLGQEVSRDLYFMVIISNKGVIIAVYGLNYRIVNNEVR
jgi:hypothetical protein